MTLLDAFKKRFGPRDRRPDWKTIAAILNDGSVIFSDGTIGKTISPKKLYPGNRVLVKEGIVLWFKWHDMKPMLPAPPPPLALIICHIGDTTSEYRKKYYSLIGEETDSTSPWDLTDDGKYGLIWNGVVSDDPDSFEYIKQYSGGLSVAAVSNGQAAKKQQGMTVRYILNQAMEDEIWKAWAWRVLYDPYFDYSYDFLELEDSLISAPFKMKSKPFVSRYTPDGVITLHESWGGQNNGVYFLNSYLSDSFQDSLPMVKKIYFTSFAGKGTAKDSLSITGDGALAAACNFYSDGRKVQEVLRLDTFPWYQSLMAEPVRRETYSFPVNYIPVDKVVGETYNRCADGGQYCYFIDGRLTSGIANIKNAVGLIYGMTESQKTEGQKPEDKKTGALDFILLEKNNDMTSLDVSLYLNDKVVEKTGPQAVLVLFPDEYPGPVYLRKTNYQILHTHHGPKFDAMIYRKTVYVSHSNAMLNYQISREGIGNCQVRCLQVQSLTTYHIAVNGMKSDLKGKKGDNESPYKCFNWEYQLLAIGTPYTVPESEAPLLSGGYMQRRPWCDVVDGENLTRIFTTEAANHLLVGFDVFPVKFRHDLTVRDNGGWLTLDALYDPSQLPFPPSSDGCYPTPKDRKWLLFDLAGNYIELPTPKIHFSSGDELVPRVNGLCLLEK